MQLKFLFEQSSQGVPQELLGWFQLCYLSSAELRFGTNRLLSSSGVQQGDPLGPLLLSLVLTELLDSMDVPANLKFQVLYLDDETIIGPCTAVADFYD